MVIERQPVIGDGTIQIGTSHFLLMYWCNHASILYRF